MSGLVPIVIIAIICAAVAGYVLAPVCSSSRPAPGMPSKRRDILIPVFILAFGSFGGYLYLGNPYVPSAPAIFETQGPGFEKRQLALEERDIMAEMASARDYPSPEIFIKLSENQSAQGNFDRAILTLERAMNTYPDNKEIQTQTGYLYYIRGLRHKIMGRLPDARRDLSKAMEIVPEDSDIYPEVKSDIEKFQNLLR